MNTMLHRTLAVAVPCLLLAAIASADTVQLPYQVPDNNGNQWMVYVQGNLQQQGNQPIFQQAGMIILNGQQPQLNNQQASYDPKTRELTLNFTNRGTLHQTRRLKFDDNSGIVRILDLFENTQGQDVSANVALTTSVNFGINDSSMITDPKAKDTNLGWIGNTGNNRAAMSLFAGKGTKVTPNIRYQPGNNQVNATFHVKVPAHKTAAIVHWHGSFDDADSANTWAAQLRESAAISDLPLDVRKEIVNLGSVAGGMVGGMEVLRGGTNDVVELRGGDQIRGDIKVDNYTLTTAYGPVVLPASKIAGIMSVGQFRPRTLLVTTSGEIFGGQLQQPSIPVQLSSGQTTQVPLEQISRIGYRATGEAPDWKLNQPMVFLADGERALIAPPTDTIDFITRYGTIKLTPEQISTVLLGTSTSSHTVYLSDGSRLSGVLGLDAWNLKLTSTSADAPTAFPLATLSRVQLKPMADDVGNGAPTISLLGTDMIAATLSGQLNVITAFDKLTVNASEIRSITRPTPGQADVQITTFDQSTFRGTLDTPTLSVKLASGTALQIPVSAMQDYDNPKPFPSAAIVKKAQEGIGQLNSDDWKQREQAEAQIVGLGSAVIGVLEQAAPTQPPEAKERISAIIKQLKKDLPTAASRLTPPPDME